MLDEYKKRAGSVFGVFGESPNEPKSRIEANKERTTNAAGSHFLPGLKKGLYLIVRGYLVVGLPALPKPTQTAAPLPLRPRSPSCFFITLIIF